MGIRATVAFMPGEFGSRRIYRRRPAQARRLHQENANTAVLHPNVPGVFAAPEPAPFSRIALIIEMNLIILYF
jgi:hypothetical protein